ncbi:unnamed protein product [Bursaphelenchus xylophilus]|uniref:Tetraspanin n=1 Tax=Bursaphelenchus xylophilus TaxID=6326 RepID=A0A1I7SR62_BURXY|nr:unnamed protein product [Bursaphelenchus xylophilus]CAG9110883.1 unnamed protein product [Bursaphelenchus xylophilus]
MGTPEELNKNRRCFYIGNVTYFILGAAFLAVGIHLYTEQHTYAALAPSSYSAMSTAGLCVCAGCMIMIVALIGYVGASLTSKWLLSVYIGFVVVLFLVQMMTGIIGFLHNELARERVKHSLYSTINRTFVTDYGPESNFRLTWDYMQETLFCCGVESYEDWYYAARWPKNKFVPDSCCKLSFFSNNSSIQNCGKVGKSEMFHEKGCYEPFADWLLHHLKIIKIFSLLFGIIEIGLVILAIRLIRYLKRLKKAQSAPSYRFTRSHRGDEKLISERT